MALEHYVIHGGLQGRERLRVLARVANPATLELFTRVGVPEAARCLDVGCGGGDVTLELARIVGPCGSVVGVDLDEAKLELARREARERGLRNVDFRTIDACAPLGQREFDVVYSRFLLTHLRDPETCLARMHEALRPGALLVIEDIDVSGAFSYPESDALRRYLQLYVAVVQLRGGDPWHGLRLPLPLAETGLERIATNVLAMAGVTGDVKRIPLLTLQGIADALLAESVVSPAELEKLVSALDDLARDDRSFISNTHVVQAWGRRAQTAPPSRPASAPAA